MRRKPEPELMDVEAEAKAYAVADFSQVNQAFVERLLELAGGPPRGQALDLGTGPADIPIRLVRTARQRFGEGAAGLHVTAVDASAPMLDLARALVRQARLEGAIRLVLADAKRTGLPDRAFGIVFSNSILHHVSDAAGFWREVRRLAGPQAFVLLRDLARPANEQAAADIVKVYAGGESATLQAEYFRSLLSAYTVDEVRSQLDAAGLTGLDVRMVTDRHLDVFGRLP